MELIKQLKEQICYLEVIKNHLESENVHLTDRLKGIECVTTVENR